MHTMQSTQLSINVKPNLGGSNSQWSFKQRKSDTNAKTQLQ